MAFHVERGVSTDSGYRHWPEWVIVAVLLSCMSHTARGQRVTLQDPHGDVRVRRTDTGADGPVGLSQHSLPDLFSVSTGTWRPSEPQTDLFSGTWSNMGQFFRLELVFDGVMNPPGPLGCCGQPYFDPFRYGPNPVSGYVEIDVDGDINTGGELAWPDLRYLGVTSRFGGRPTSSALGQRVAVDSRAFDQNLATPPFVERSGEDFHLELVGWEIDSDHIHRSDTTDWLFGPGETWIITGHLLHRAHAYSRFSSACCRSGVEIGNYEPLVSVQFAHNVMSDRTTVSLVYPLTQAASAASRGSATTEPMDVLFTNQNSIQESLWELVISAWAASPLDRLLPEFALIAPWETKNPDAFLDPSLWQVRVLVGGHYTSQQDSFFVWSDIYPNVVVGDFDGNGVVNPADLAAFDLYLLSNDGNATLDADGTVNASIEILNFGPAFSLYDINYDGLIDAEDRAAIGGPMMPRADFDRDGDVDQADFAHMQRCMSSSAPLRAGCRNADLLRNGRIDQDDLVIFMECASGPGIPANPACGRP